MSEQAGPPECLLREYIEALQSGAHGLTYVRDRKLDIGGNGYGNRACGGCALTLIAKNGSVGTRTNPNDDRYVEFDKTEAVTICASPDISDPDSVPNIIC